MLVTLHIQRIEMSSVFSDLMSALLPSPQDRDKEEKNLLSFFFFTNISLNPQNNKAGDIREGKDPVENNF